MLKQIKYFQSVVEENSFTKAADSHFISQSAILQQIRSLETELGVTLLTHKNRGFELTEVGRYFYEKSLALVAYTGDTGDTGVGGSWEAFSTSSELTTNGMLRKAWRFVEDDGNYLYKGGTEGAANTGNEPYSEYYACQIADKMGFGCVQYDLENWKGILASKCRLFTDIEPLSSLLGVFSARRR